MIAGIVFGPHTPGLDFVTDPADLELVATLGLVLLLFYLGLEFSINELIQGAASSFLAGGIYLALNVGAGLAFGFALGWGDREAFVIAGAVGISSSAIVTKLLVELNRLANRETRLILGIIVVEDLFLALYLAVAAADHRRHRGRRRRGDLHREGVRFPPAARDHRPLGRAASSDDSSTPTTTSCSRSASWVSPARRRHRRRARRLRRHRRVHDRPHPRREPRRANASSDWSCRCATRSPRCSSSRSASPSNPTTSPRSRDRSRLAVVMTPRAQPRSPARIAARLYRFGRTAAANVGLTILARGEFSLILAALAAAAGLDDRIGPFVAGYVLVLALSAPILAAQTHRLVRLIPSRRAHDGPPVVRELRLPMPPETEALGEDGSNFSSPRPGTGATCCPSSRLRASSWRRGHEIDLVVPSGFHDSLADEPVTLHRLGVEFSPPRALRCVPRRVGSLRHPARRRCR